MDPVLGGELVERQQRLPVTGERGHGLGPLGEVTGEGLQGTFGVVFVPGVGDLPQPAAGLSLDRGRQGV